MARELDQAARRAHITMTDQFGRRWNSTQDIIARGTCAPINPNFVDPLNTPQKYLKADVTTLSLYVDLEAWTNDLEYAHKTYEQKLMDDSLMLFGENGMRMYTERAPALLRYTGEPPQPLEPVKAAMQGNKFCLGLTDAMPKWAEKHFIKPKAAAVENIYGLIRNPIRFSSR